ncbi:hypothetical protein SDC9_72853 [bioreactor metagenome]|jgi:hypothetical protein|uniref:Uncharacterized protein DUF1858 n=2 Tax=root TaxID=1 RepID=A0A562J4V9_9FIRM|nr:DUF1858 domain-containing protein [Sedimentibacter saalensis]MEA5096270.1 DUF1858 domain-containing protein [Sedimentibacter saalensis]TWH78127.1 uncharacterized protein DUF1858 [Sedimentibacter saalensis]
MEIDFNKSVHDLCKEYPDVKNILAELGFSDITKPGMLETAGRFMTIKKGSIAKGIEIEKIKQEFIRRGYEIKQ